VAHAARVRTNNRTDEDDAYLAGDGAKCWRLKISGSNGSRGAKPAEAADTPD
jgi:hypothetical protein